MGRVRLPHIYRFYLSLTALPCRSRRSHTCSRREEKRDRKRERGREKEKREKERMKTKENTIERKDETQGEIYRDDPVMGQLRAVVVASTRHFTSRHLFANIISFEDSLICWITLVLLCILFQEIQHFFANIDLSEKKKKRLTNKNKI